MTDTYSYTAADQHTWRSFFDAVEQFWTQRADAIHPWYLDHVEVLYKFRNKIPTLEELNQVLEGIGWQAQYVDGLAPAWDIARMLHQKIMPVSRSIRSPEEVFFANEPDLIHDIFGHLPSLMDADYRRLLAMWSAGAARFPITEMDKAMFYLNKQIVQSEGKLSVDTMDFLHNAATELNQFTSRLPSPTVLFEKIYFWIFEFGIIRHQGQYRFLGAGLLSSLSELKKMALDQFAVKPLDIDSVLAPYNISTFQEGYLAAASLGQCEQVIQQILESVGRQKRASFDTVAHV